MALFMAKRLLPKSSSELSPLGDVDSGGGIDNALSLPLEVGSVEEEAGESV
jgi:hypothetical protein